jgi:hypothetical protein
MGYQDLLRRWPAVLIRKAMIGLRQAEHIPRDKLWIERDDGSQCKPEPSNLLRHT